MRHLWNKLHLLGKILLNLRSDHRAAGELRRVGDTVAVPVLHVRGGSHHVPATDAVLVALLLYRGVEQPLYIAGVLYGLHNLCGGVGVLGKQRDCSAAYYPLTERQLHRLVLNAVKLDLVLL